MLGYPYEVVCETITNTIATVGGMVCDGAKSSCAAKISTALQTALLGMHSTDLEILNIMLGN